MNQSSISRFFRPQPKTAGSSSVPLPARKRRKLHGSAKVGSTTEATFAAGSKVEVQAQAQAPGDGGAEAQDTAMFCARTSNAASACSAPMRPSNSLSLQLPPIELDGERADAARTALRNCLWVSGARDGADATVDGAAGTSDCSESRRPNRVNVAQPSAYTPLERQVLELRKNASGAVMLVECGYRFRFFGRDARIAASVLSIYAHRDHNFDVASVPVHRVAVHLRRLLQAGHRVAVARQCEYASLRKEARAKEREEAARSERMNQNKGKSATKRTKGNAGSSKTFDREIVALYTHASPLPATDAELLDELGIDDGKRAGEAGGPEHSSSWRSRGWNWKRGAIKHGDGGGQEDSIGVDGAGGTDADASAHMSNVVSSHPGDSTGTVVAALFGFPEIAAVGVIAVDLGSVPGVLAIDLVGCDREKAASADDDEEGNASTNVNANGTNEGAGKSQSEDMQGEDNDERDDVRGRGGWWTPASIATASLRAAEEDGLLDAMIAGVSPDAGAAARGAEAAWLRWRRALHTSSAAAVHTRVPIAVDVSTKVAPKDVPSKSVAAVSASADAACATGVMTRLRQLEPTELLLSSDDSTLPPVTMRAVQRWLETDGGESCRLERVAFSAFQTPSASVVEQQRSELDAQSHPDQDMEGKGTWASRMLDALRMLLRASNLSRDDVNSTASMHVSCGAAGAANVATCKIPRIEIRGQELHRLPPPCFGALALLIHHLHSYRLDNILQLAPALATTNVGNGCDASDVADDSGGVRLGAPLVWLRSATGSHDRFMHLDGDTLHDLSVVRAPAGAAGESGMRNNVGAGGEDGGGAWRSLLWLLSRGLRTRAGARLMRRWLTHPLAQCAAIEARLDAVAALAKADNHALFDGVSPGAGSSMPSGRSSANSGTRTDLNIVSEMGSEDSGDAADTGCSGGNETWRGYSRRLLLGFHPLVTLLRCRGAKERLPDLALCVTRLRLGRGAPHEVVRMLRALHGVAGAAITARAAAQHVCAGASAEPRCTGPPPPSQLLALALSAGDAGERVRGACNGLLSLLGLDGKHESAGSIALPPRTELFHEAERAAQELVTGAGTDDSRGNDTHTNFAALLGRELLSVRQRIAAAQRRLDIALAEARSVLQKPSLKYRTLRTGPTSQLEHLLELRRTEPAARRVPGDWLQVSATKEYLRYHTPAALSAAHELECARERLAIAADTAWKRFCKHAVEMLDGVSDKSVYGDAGTDARASAGADADADVNPPTYFDSDGTPKVQDVAETLSVAPVDTLLGCFARLDALLALAATARMPGYCRPSYVQKPGASDDTGTPNSSTLARPHAAMLVRGARHPLLERVLDHGVGAGNAADGIAATCGSFVPNDIALAWGGASFAEAHHAARVASQWHEGSPLLPPRQPQKSGVVEPKICAPQCVLLTGPNAGGKSCYARTVAILAIMGQCGAFIPATRAEMPPFDCVCTRMGASDDLAAGKSTFLVELERASAILSRVTSRSLVVLDELGRGTSTHDGVAIAYATLRHLVGSTGSAVGCDRSGDYGARKTKSLDNAMPLRGQVLRVAQAEAQRPEKGPRCCSIFVTHYHALSVVADELPGEVINAHMSYLENSPAIAPTLPHVPSVTFLYQLASGTAPASFGLNIARAAGLPPQVLQSAAERAAAMRRHSTSGLDGNIV